MVFLLIYVLFSLNRAISGSYDIYNGDIIRLVFFLTSSVAASLIWMKLLVFYNVI